MDMSIHAPGNLFGVELVACPARCPRLVVTNNTRNGLLVDTTARSFGLFAIKVFGCTTVSMFGTANCFDAEGGQSAKDQLRDIVCLYAALHRCLSKPLSGRFSYLTQSFPNEPGSQSALRPQLLTQFSLAQTGIPISQLKTLKHDTCISPTPSTLTVFSKLMPPVAGPLSSTGLVSRLAGMRRGPLQPLGRLRVRPNARVQHVPRRRHLPRPAP